MTILTDPDTASADAALNRLLAPPGLVDPYPDLAILRREQPVYRSRFGVIFASSHQACAQLLSDPAFVVQDTTWFDANQAGWRDRPATATLYQGVQSMNPPDHTRMRRVLGRMFSPGRLAQLRAQVQVLTGRFLDRLADAGSDGGPVDLMSTLAVPLPFDVISGMLGVPEADRPRFHGVASKIFNLMDLFVTAQDRLVADEATAALREYWTELIAVRRRAPEQDLTTELTQACDTGLINHEELLATLIFLLAAGYGTTGALIGNATAALLEHPDRADRLRADPGYAPAVVEESLRYEAPSQIDPRLCARDVELAGTAIQAGEFVIAFLGAGNRDPKCFAAADRFDPDRTDNAKLLSFGGGIHYCLGAPLSRLEASIVLPALFRRFPRLAFAEPPTRRRALRMRQFELLPLTLA